MNMQMRISRVLEKLRSGDVAWASKINLTDPKCADLVSMCGVDCLWLDLEHVPASIVELDNQVRAGKVHNVDSMVRIQKGSYSDYVRPLEMDAAGIMIPHLMSAAEAEEIVQTVRFHPQGKRAMDGGNSDGAYTMIDVDTYLKQSNEERFVVVQIEDPEPLEEIDEICKIPGIDVIFFGPGDFAHRIGLPGQYDHQDVLDAKRRIVETAQKHGKFAGVPAGPDSVRATVDMGYKFITMGADVHGVSTYYQNLNNIMNEIRK